MSDIKLPAHCVGSKFRPVDWHDMEQGEFVLVGWGIAEKAKGKRAYVPRSYKGKTHPFKTKEEAQQICDALNAQSAARQEQPK